VLSGRGLEVCEMKGSVAEGRQLRTAALEELTVLVDMVLSQNLSKRRSRGLNACVGKREDQILLPNIYRAHVEATDTGCKQDFEAVRR
jgi:hypothetical protein